MTSSRLAPGSADGLQLRSGGPVRGRAAAPRTRAPHTLAVEDVAQEGRIGERSLEAIEVDVRQREPSVLPDVRRGTSDFERYVTLAREGR